MRRTAVDLFSGIGGFALACEWAGVETVAFAEIDDYASRVLRKHWPGIRNYGDVRSLPSIEGAWLLCGGPPCQPASSAGRRQGANDDRWLWPETLAAVEKFAPEWCLFENPTGILSLDDGLEFENICVALEGQGYEVQPIVIPACAVNALHRRDRVWICAHSRHNNGSTEHQQQQEERSEIFDRSSAIIANAERAWESQQSRGKSDERKRTVNGSEANGYATVEGLPNWAGGTLGQPSPLTEFERPGGREIERDFCGISHGVSARVHRLRCLGNAIVPQIAFQLIKRMIEAEMLG